jgi:hypothetical protein
MVCRSDCCRPCRPNRNTLPFWAASRPRRGSNLRFRLPGNAGCRCGSLRKSTEWTANILMKKFSRFWMARTSSMSGCAVQSRQCPAVDWAQPRGGSRLPGGGQGRSGLRLGLQPRRTKEAIDCLKRALDADPGYLDAMFNMGLFLQRLPIAAAFGWAYGFVGHVGYAARRLNGPRLREYGLVEGLA